MIVTFSILFIIGVIGIIAVMTRKVPLVLATPRQVVDDYMEQESARLHVRMLRIRRWFEDGEYWDPILFLLLRTVRTLRIFILKMDRWTFSLTQLLNEHYEARKNGEEVKAEELSSPEGVQATPVTAEFWQELKNKDTEGTTLSV